MTAAVSAAIQSRPRACTSRPAGLRTIDGEPFSTNFSTITRWRSIVASPDTVSARCPAGASR